ncbi:MAG TPA: hypothetical protein VFB55_05875 [Verrucomicrobiae bacterium]|nr:hypothetical protein [Verrucomicrobiae bacterium]
MKKYFAQLRPMERRLAVGVLVAFVIVLNGLYIWPHFADWSNWRRRLDDARHKLALYQSVISEKSKYEALVRGYEANGDYVAPEDQAINLLRTIQSQAAASHVNIISMSRQTTRTNDAFFVEQMQNVNVSGNDEQLVDFLYKLGSSASMIRVRDLELQPDPPRLHLNANIRLVASYQRKSSSPPAPVKTGTATAKVE